MAQDSRCCWWGKTSCCCFMTFLSFLSLFAAVFFIMIITAVPDWENMLPGDKVRREIQETVFRSMQEGDFTALHELYNEPNSALLLGNSSGPFFEKQVGHVALERPFFAASQTKIVTALTIYRLIAKDGSRLNLTSQPSHFFPVWPRQGPSRNVTLAHLLAFTTGFGPLDFEKPGCARPGYEEDSLPWDVCIAEIAGYEFEFAPGKHFQYGPWHLFVAAGMAMRAFELPLTGEVWLDLVFKEVFVPCGIKERPISNEELLPLGLRRGDQLPDFSGGLKMSGRQWQKIYHMVMYGHLLPEQLMERFLSEDYGAEASRSEADLGWHHRTGQWRYSQGHWIACDAAAELSAATLEEANPLCAGANRTPNIHHSVGLYGTYVWMDLTNDYYGVFMHDWLTEILASMWSSVAWALVMAFLPSIPCAWFCCSVIPRRKHPNKVESGQQP